MIVFKDWLLDLGKKVIDWFVHGWEKLAESFWNRRRDKRVEIKKSKRDDAMVIGALEQKVKGLIDWKREVTKEWRASQKREKKCAENHTSCLRSLTEARTQITDLYLWKKSIEKKMKHKTA